MPSRSHNEALCQGLEPLVESVWYGIVQQQVALSPSTLRNLLFPSQPPCESFWYSTTGTQLLLLSPKPVTAYILRFRGSSSIHYPQFTGHLACNNKDFVCCKIVTPRTGVEEELGREQSLSTHSALGTRLFFGTKKASTSKRLVAARRHFLLYSPHHTSRSI